jgi:hypothetical protein
MVVALLISACGGGSSSRSSSSEMPISDYTAFSNPELVSIVGYSGDAMEPFLSRDGHYLFFNNAGGPTSKDLFYATSVDETTFEFEGALSAINTAAVDGVPTMDDADTFYYVSTVNYSPPNSYDTIYSGNWTGSTVTGSTPVTGLATPTPGFIIFDVEVSPDGSTLYFTDGDFRGGNAVPDAANIAVAVASGNGFVRDPESAAIMANVNTVNLEYAPAISGDGLELFFTRFDLSANKSRIYRTTRTSTSSPFAAPQLVSAIDGVVEAPAFSPDEKSLYYHRLNTTTGRFEIYGVTRP